jgi:hypothetical protein
MHHLRALLAEEPSLRPQLLRRFVVAGTSLYLAFALRAALLALLVLILPALIVLGHVPLLGPGVDMILDTVGDVLACAADAPSRAQMEERIRRDLAWCEARVGAGNVIVLAHSQGGLLARSVLDGHVPPVHEFISLGSGLGAIHVLAHRDRLARVLWSWLSLAFTGASFVIMVDTLAGGWSDFRAALVAGAHLIVDVPRALVGELPVDRLQPGFTALRHGFESQDRQMLQVGVGLALCLVGAACLKRAGMTQMLETWAQDLHLDPPPTWGWKEFSSRYDPVSCGDLLKAVAQVVPVCNTSVLLLEHVRYHRNPLVLLPVVRALTRDDEDRADLDPEAVFRLGEAGQVAQRRRARTLHATVIVAWSAALASAVIRPW